MKKLKVFLVSLLAMLTVLFCFSGCFGGVAGVYKVTDYRVGGMHFDAPANNPSYIEIKDDNTVEIDVSVGSVLSLKETGTWVETEEKDKYRIETEYDAYEAYFKNGALVVEFDYVTVIAEKK